MHGYDVGYGYMGFIDGRYRLFATEDEYISIITHKYEDCKEDVKNGTGKS